MAKQWRGRAVTQAREFMDSTTPWPAPCGQCGVMVQRDEDWNVGHIKARGTHPELTWEHHNWRIEHRRCSNKTGQAGVIAKAKADALREQGVTTRTTVEELDEPTAHGMSVFPGPGPASESPPLPASLSDGPQDVPAALRWDPEALARYSWLLPLLVVPEDAAPPLMMTPVPEDAVGTYGWDAVAWVEAELRITLRWWQRLSLVRRLEHREDGSLCHRTVLSSAPRRAGKSVGQRGHALWRLEHGQELFGEVQLVMHTGSDMAICREIQRAAWVWAEGKGWIVTRGNGKEAIERAGEDRWLVRAQDAVYGYDVTVGMVDEAWNVKPDTVNEGLEPATLERSSPQVDLTSTAHRRATSLMRTALKDAQAMTDPETLLLLWGAPIGSDPSDEAVWRAASPHWSEDRRKLMAKKYEKALAGEDDPEFDDPDPMKGFEAQYLNIWRIAEAKTIGNPIVEADVWADLGGVVPDRAPDVVAVEAWFADGVAVASAWRQQDGPVVVSVTDYPDTPAAAAAVAALKLGRPALVGTSLTDHATWREQHVRVTKMSDSTRSQVGDLVRYLAEGAFLHDGSAVLGEQVLEVRVSPGVDGPRIRSTGRADAIKATVWAITEAMNTTSSGVDEVIFVDW